MCRFLVPGRLGCTLCRGGRAYLVPGPLCHRAPCLRFPRSGCSAVRGPPRGGVKGPVGRSGLCYPCAVLVPILVPDVRRHRGGNYGKYPRPPAPKKSACSIRSAGACGGGIRCTSAGRSSTAGWRQHSPLSRPILHQTCPSRLEGTGLATSARGQLFGGIPAGSCYRNASKYHTRHFAFCSP